MISREELKTKEVIKETIRLANIEHNINPHLQREAQKVLEANGVLAEEVPNDAVAILNEAANTIYNRAASRDIEQERSAELTVEIFNAITGRDLTEEDGWIFLLALKLARSRRGTVNPDDLLDLVGYSALLAECSAKG